MLGAVTSDSVHPGQVNRTYFLPSISTNETIGSPASAEVHGHSNLTYFLPSIFTNETIGSLLSCEAYGRAKPQVLEPLMKGAVETPNELQGDVIATLSQRRGTIIGTTEDQGFVRIEAEVPLEEGLSRLVEWWRAERSEAEGP